MAYTFDQYRASLRDLAAGKIQVVMVSRSEPGLGVVTVAREELEAADRVVHEIRIEMLDGSDFKRVPYLRGGEMVYTDTTPFQELFLKAKREGAIMVLDGVDLFFRPGTNIYIEHLIEAAKTEVPMVWIGDQVFKTVCNTYPTIIASPDSTFGEITITDEDRLEWLGRQISHWDQLSEDRRGLILVEARDKGMREAITNELVRNLKTG